MTSKKKSPHGSGPRRVAVVTLGCPKNLVDSEVLMAQMEANGLQLTEPGEADIIIVNTCGFIDAAKQESIDTILGAIELKSTGRVRDVYVAGCLSERYREDLGMELPEVDAFFGVTDFAAIMQQLGGSFREEAAHARHLATPSHTAYLKISEGCDHPCSFCAIPIMRGAHRSRPMDEIVAEARSLAAAGVKELIVIGQDTTFYGHDTHGRRLLAPLLERLADIDGITWVRLMYTYPSHFPKDVLALMARHPSICRYIDMPIQHIDDGVLRSMRRGISAGQTRALIAEMRDAVPDLAIRSTLIVGYPAETPAAFDRLLRFVEDTAFDRLGVFTYSPEEGTTAAMLGDPIDAAVKEERRAMLMELQQDISLSRNRALVGRTLTVLFDDIDGGQAIGRTQHDAPEIDNNVLVPAEAGRDDGLIGKFLPVRIDEALEFDVTGTIV